ncbi:MAG: hypothetical protein NTY76_00295 [Candidatus Omnitrophica bacterium]|nr:hypothetical protein [Candidatus Omnitrophota bacterium]
MPEDIIIGIDNADVPLYEKLKKEVLLFGDQGNTELLMFAIGYGYKHNKPLPLRAKYSGFTRTKYLKPDDLALLKALALQVGGIETLKDQSRMVEIAEKYAHGGIQLLMQEIGSSSLDSFEIDFELSLSQHYDTITNVQNS